MRIRRHSRGWRGGGSRGCGRLWRHGERQREAWSRRQLRLSLGVGGAGCSVSLTQLRLGLGLYVGGAVCGVSLGQLCLGLRPNYSVSLAQLRLGLRAG